MARVSCPYCGARCSRGGCMTRHVMRYHPDKKQHYIENYVNKRGW